MEIDIASCVLNGDELTIAPFHELGADLLERSGLSGSVLYDKASGLYWLKNAGMEWEGIDARNFATYLKFQGYCPVVRTKPVADKISEVDHLLAHIKLNCAVQYAGQIAGFKKGVLTNNGQKVLVTREAKIMKPEPGEWPTLDLIFTQMFGHGSPDRENDGPDQLPHFYGWWKHALECLHNRYDDKRCLCMTFAGSAGCGKTLVKDLISLSLGGRECKPYRFMIGQDNFNGEFIGSELHVVDDEQASTRSRDRSEFGANIKKVVADRYYRIRGMMRDGVVLEMFRCMLICVNREPERLMVLPQLDDDISDKISILLAHKHPMPMPTGAPAEKTEFWNTITGELPHFIHYLLNEYTIAPEMYGRFGPLAFHHPDLCSDLFQVSRDREFWAQVCRVLKARHFRDADDFTGAVWFWHGGAEALYELMSGESTPLSRNEINNLPWTNKVGECLTKISKVYPDRVVKKKVKGLVQWFIAADGRRALDAVELIRAGRLPSGQVDFEEPTP